MMSGQAKLHGELLRAEVVTQVRGQRLGQRSHVHRPEAIAPHQRVDLDDVHHLDALVFLAAGQRGQRDLSGVLGTAPALRQVLPERSTRT